MFVVYNLVMYHLKKPSESEIEVRKSRFIGLLFPVEKPEDAAGIVNELRKKYYTASHFCITDPSSLSVHSRDLSGQVFDYKNFRDIKMPLLGAYQTENAAAVLEIISCLRARGYKISDESVRTGLLNARWPGRFELLSTEPVLIVDGAHNPDGVTALINSIKSFLPDKKICFVMGVMKDKDYHEMLRLITPFAESFVTELPYSARGLDPEILKKEIASYFSGPVDTAGSVTEAVDKALAHAKETNTPVICFGSLYQVADIRKYIITTKEK